jgi:hypothetical protein
MPKTYTLNMNLVNNTKRRGHYPPFTNGPIALLPIALLKPTGFSEEAVSGLTAPRKPCPLDPAAQTSVRFKGTVDVCLSVETPANSETFHVFSNFLGPEGLVGSGGGSGITGTEKLTEGILLLFADCSLLVFSVFQQSLELKC